MTISLPRFLLYWVAVFASIAGAFWFLLVEPNTVLNAIFVVGVCTLAFFPYFQTRGWPDAD